MPPPPPLEWQNLDIPCYRGIDEAQDDWTVAPGNLLHANNVVASKTKALHKRNGFTIMSTTLANAAGAWPTLPMKCFTAGDELCAVVRGDSTFAGGQNALVSYSPGLGAWAYRDTVTPCVMTKTPAVRTSAGLQGAGSITSDANVTTQWYMSDQALYLRAVDATTGAVLVNDVQVALQSGAQIAAIQVAGYSICVYAATNGISPLRAVVFDASTLIASAPITIDADLCHNFDISYVEGASNRFALIWIRDNSRDRFRIAELTAAACTPVAAAVRLAGTSLAACTLAVKSGGTFYAFAWDDVSNDYYGASCNESTFAVTTAPTILFRIPGVLAHGACINASGDAHLLVHASMSTAPNGMARVSVNAAMATTLNVSFAYNCGLASKPFRARDGHTYAVLWQAYDYGYGNNRPGAHVLCRTDEVATTGAFRIASIITRYGAPSSPVLYTPVQLCSNPDGQRYAFAYGAGILTGRTGSSSYSYGMDTVTLDFRAPQAALWNAADAQGGALLTGGCTQHYDGQAVVENGFLFPPKIASLAQSNTGTGAIANGKYLYCAIFEWWDADGNVHVSQVSELATITTAGANNTVTITLKTLPLTERAQVGDGANRDVRIYTFRTKASGQIFYRMQPRNATPGTPNYIINDRSQPTVTFVDTMSDATLESVGAGYVYTDGGILETQPAPASLASVVHKNRVWLISAEDARKIYYSKILTPAEPPGFNDALSLRVDDSPEEATALASLDDKLVIFTPSRVYVVVGDGPDDTGFNGTFSAPQLLTTNVGCDNPRSVQSFSEGVLFQSRAGLSLLDRGGTVKYLSDTQTTMDNAVVTASAHQRSAGRLLWAVPAQNKVVLYDYFTDVWSTWTFDAQPLAMCDWAAQGALVLGLAGGGLYQEASGQHPGLDGNAWIVSDIRTPWVHVAGYEGFARTKRVTLTLRPMSAHQIYVQIFADYDGVTPKQTAVFDVGVAPLSTATTVTERLQVHLNAACQKASALMIRVYDAPTDAGGEIILSGTPVGAHFVVVSLLVGTKAGAAKLPAVQKG